MSYFDGAILECDDCGGERDGCTIKHHRNGKAPSDLMRAIENCAIERDWTVEPVPTYERISGKYWRGPLCAADERKERETEMLQANGWVELPE